MAFVINVNGPSCWPEPVGFANFVELLRVYCEDIVFKVHVITRNNLIEAMSPPCALEYYTSFHEILPTGWLQTWHTMVRPFDCNWKLMRNFNLGFRFEGDWNDEKILDLLAGPGSPLIAQDRPLELVLGRHISDFLNPWTDCFRYQAHRIFTPAACRPSGIHFWKTRKEEALSFQHYRRLWIRLSHLLWIC